MEEVRPPFLAIFSRDWDSRKENPVQQLKEMTNSEKKELDEEYAMYVGPKEKQKPKVPVPEFVIKGGAFDIPSYLDPRSNSIRKGLKAWKRANHLEDNEIKRLKEDNMNIRRSPEKPQLHLLKKANNREDVYFKFITLVIGYICTFIENPCWSRKNKEEVEEMEKRSESKSQSNRPISKPGVYCKIDTYELLMTQLSTIMEETQMYTLPDHEPGEERKNIMVETLKFMDKMLKMQEWGHQEKRELIYEIEEARQNYHKHFGGKHGKTHQLKVELYAQLGELIPTRFRYYEGEIKHLDRGVYRETDDFFNLVDEIIELPEWEEEDWSRVQKHFHQMQKAGLHPNMPLEHRSPHAKINAYLLKYMQQMCKQLKYKARESNDSFLHKMYKLKAWSYDDISRLYLRLKDTNRWGMLREDQLTPDQEKMLHKLISQADKRMNANLGRDYNFLPRDYVSPMERKADEAHRFDETEDSITTTNLIRKLYMMPHTEWTRRDLYTLRQREENDYQEKISGHSENWYHIQAITLLHCKTLEAFSMNLARSRSQQDQAKEDHLGHRYMDPWGDQEESCIRSGSKKKENMWIYHIKEGDAKYKKVKDNAKKKDYDLLLTSPGGFGGNVIFQKQQITPQEELNNEQGHWVDKNTGIQGQWIDKNSHQLSRRPKTQWKQLIINNNGQGHLDTTRTSINEEEDQEDHMLVMQAARRERREKMEINQEKTEEILPTEMFKEKDEETTHAEEKQTMDQEIQTEEVLAEEGMIQDPTAEMEEIQEIQVLGTIQLDETQQHTANLLSDWPWNVTKPDIETLQEMIPEDEIVQPLANRLLMTMTREGVNMAACHSIIGPGLIFAMSRDTLNKWIEYRITEGNKDSYACEDDQEATDNEENHLRPEFSGTSDITQTEGPLKIEIHNHMQEEEKQTRGFNALRPQLNQDVRNNLSQFRCGGLENSEEDLQLIWISLIEKHIKNKLQSFKEEKGQKIPQSKEEWRRAILKMGFNGGSDENDSRIYHKIIIESLAEMGIEIDWDNWDSINTEPCCVSPIDIFNPYVFHQMWCQALTNGHIFTFASSESTGEVWKQPVKASSLKTKWDQICEGLFNVRLHRRADAPQEEKQEYGDYVIGCIQDSLKAVGIYLPEEMIKEEIEDGSPLHSIGIWQLAMRHIRNCVFDLDYQFNEEMEKRNPNEPPYPQGYDINFGLWGKDDYANKIRAVDDVDHTTDETTEETHTIKVGIIRYYGEEMAKRQATPDMIKWTKIEQSRPKMIKAFTNEKFIMEITSEGSEEQNGVSKVYLAHAPFSKWNKIVMTNLKGIVATIWVKDTTPRWEKYLGRKHKRNLCRRKCCTQHKKNFMKREENTRGQRHINRLMNESINSYSGFSGKIQNKRILNQDPFIPCWFYTEDESKKTSQPSTEPQPHILEGVHKILQNDKPWADRIRELQSFFKLSDPLVAQITTGEGEINVENIYHVYRSYLGETGRKGISISPSNPSDPSGEQDSNSGSDTCELTGPETFITGMLTGVLINFIMDCMFS